MEVVRVFFIFQIVISNYFPASKTGISNCNPGQLFQMSSCSNATAGVLLFTFSSPLLMDFVC